MFSISQFIEQLETLGATRAEVEGGKVPRVVMKGAWKNDGAPVSREMIESALQESLSPTHKRELSKSEGRFWFRHERPLGVWMVRVEWKNVSLLSPIRRLIFVSSAAMMSDPLEAAETNALISTEKAPQFKSAAQEALLRADKTSGAPRHVEQMQEAARQSPSRVQPPAPERIVAAQGPPPLPANLRPPVPQNADPAAGKHWEPPPFAPPSPPSALEKQLDAVSPLTWRLISSSILGVMLFFTMRGCNGMRLYSSMLAKSVVQDANSSAKWRSRGVALDEVRLHPTDADSYTGTGTYTDGTQATVDVEIQTWTWNNTPSTWDYKVTPWEQ